MNTGRFEVVYQDKFTDLLEAELTRENLRVRFGLDDRTLNRLHSGSPVIVKKQISLSAAEKLRAAIAEAGGTCWIQELPPDGRHFERRQEQRRVLKDRRKEVRPSSIVPDRRVKPTRRG